MRGVVVTVAGGGDAVLAGQAPHMQAWDAAGPRGRLGVIAVVVWWCMGRGGGVAVVWRWCVFAGAL